MYKLMIGLSIAVLTVLMLSTAAHADYWDDDVIDVYTPIDTHSLVGNSALYDTSTFSSQSDLFDFNSHNSLQPSFDNNMSAFRLQSDLFDYHNVNSYTQPSFIDNWHQFNTPVTLPTWNNDLFDPGMRLIQFQQPRIFDYHQFTLPTYKPDPILRGRVFDKIRDMPAVPTFKPQPVRRYHYGPRG